MQMSVHLSKRFRVWLLLFLAVTCLGAAAERSVYSQSSNKDLKQRTLRLVKNIRDLVESYNQKDRELMTDYDKKNRPEYRTDERKAIREQWMRQSDSVHDATIRRYKENSGPTPFFCSMNCTAAYPSACVRKISCRFISIPPTFSAWKPSPITWS